MTPARPLRARALPVALAALLVGAPLLVGAGPAQAAASATASPYVFTVTSVGDEDDIGSDGACRTAVGTCTLRAAITESKRQTSTPVVIGFALPGTGPFTISPQTRLPSLTNPAGVTIDGYSQAGATPNTSATTSNAVLRVSLVGQGPTGIDGLFITSTNNVVRGLSVYEFRHDVWLYGTTAGNNAVLGSFIGTDPTGTHTATYDRAGSSGITLQGGAYGNRIGSPARADRNVISGNYANGVATYDAPTRDNTIAGNLIGLTPAGTARLGNRSHGVDINTSTTGTLVGGTQPGAANVLSGNLGEGVEISHGSGNKNNNIIGNYIGTGPNGRTAPAYAANRQWGVRLEGAQTCDPCGDDAGPALVQGNVIVQNGKGGVLIDKGFHDATLRGNWIGTLRNGAAAGNGLWGVRVAHGAHRITVGPGNVIAYNAQGVQVDGIGVSPNDPTSQPTSTKITRNRIFANRDGLGIDLTPLGTANTAAKSDPTINGGMLAPLITKVTATALTGTTCAGCVVEAYRADRAAGSIGSGRRFLSSTTAGSDGAFSVRLGAAAQGATLTVDATRGGSTSEFSVDVAVPAAAVTG